MTDLTEQGTSSSRARATPSRALRSNRSRLTAPPTPTTSPATKARIMFRDTLGALGAEGTAAWLMIRASALGSVQLCLRAGSTSPALGVLPRSHRRGPASGPGIPVRRQQAQPSAAHRLRPRVPHAIRRSRSRPHAALRRARRDGWRPVLGSLRCPRRFGHDVRRCRSPHSEWRWWRPERRPDPACMKARRSLSKTSCPASVIYELEVDFETLFHWSDRFAKLSLERKCSSLTGFRPKRSAIAGLAKKRDLDESVRTRTSVLAS